MDDFDDGDYLDMDNDWIYVEDEYDLADELAENAIPDPGYMGTSAEIAMESYEFDFYGYQEDLEYGEDPYWDAADPRAAHVRPGKVAKATRTGAKRKRNNESTPSSKRQKLAPIAREAQPVIFRSRSARQDAQSRTAPTVKGAKTFALLPDWRERFKDADGVVKNKRMPAAMAKAAYEEAPDENGEEEAEEAEEAPTDAAEMQEEEEEEEWESDEEEGTEGGGIDIDPDTLKAILAQRLAEAGITGDEKASFLESFNDMLSGEGKGEAAATLLEKAQSDSGRKRKADSAVGLEPEQKKGRNGKGGA
ncbi:hypothetical protein CB0940_08343 [Cercospora beticola]|uniref:Uncharacterized protein n=1 Tax=Cercospora beticola TaxID=122368 RepID=A0A2G5HRG6_CERBT|nr:hypothetical protein CB0940_08343 [Cercospora beticola]PIA95134.1 hypothetical protein CB0940_08343 [Cercospora beticola]WPB04915.1 hypothetical protein RHO25_009563 [Cercospora beticola]CAK1364683.1 unnamed protein product [Cercospora beticola]